MDKKTYFVLGSMLVVILLMIAWVYLLFFTTPGSVPGTFTDLEFTDGSSSSITEVENTTVVSPTSEVATGERNPLRQLSIRPVAGYQSVIDQTTATPAVLLVEQGTGHIYNIDPKTGVEKRVSGTTIPFVTEAKISPDGSTVVTRSGQGSRSTVQIGNISTSSTDVSFTPLPGQWLDFSFASSGELFLAEQTQASVKASSLDIITNKTTPLFTIPFREAVILWGSEPTDTHYTYPKATHYLEGALFAITNGTLRRLPVSGHGLTAMSVSNGIVYSVRSGERSYGSWFMDKNTNKSTPLAITFIPDKCGVLQGPLFEQVFCASTLNAPPNNLPDMWYQGGVPFTDELWELNSFDGTATFLVDPVKVINRTLNIHTISSDPLVSELYFINASDNTLWLYEL